jgi:hypothetical protein
MEIAGHETRSVFDRYNITSGTDLRAAAEAMHRAHGGPAVLREPNGHNLDTAPDCDAGAKPVTH